MSAPQPWYVRAVSVFKTHPYYAGIAVIALGVGALWYAQSSNATSETRYVTTLAAIQTLVSSISGSGQIESVNQVDIKPQASGVITSVQVTEGQRVKQGQVIATIDATQALKSVRDAQANLKSAQIALQKLQQPADQLSLTQQQNTLARANENKQTAQDQISKEYDDGFNQVASTFLDLPAVMAGLQTMLFTSSPQLSQQFWNVDFYANAISQYDTRSTSFRKDVGEKYQIARASFDKNFSDYKNASRNSDRATIDKLIAQTYETTKEVADAVKSANNLLQLYKDQMAQQSLTPASLADTHLNTLNTYTSQVNSHLSSLSATQNSIKSDLDTITNAERTIIESTQSLAKLKAGTEALDLESAQLSVDRARNALIDAQQTLADYTVRAPFDGLVASINAVKGGDAGSAVATVISTNKIASLSLNEVDAAKVKVGQKATLTFDAIDGLTVTGKVISVDPLGSVTQGVVSYVIKIGLDDQNESVKSGMSVSASIVTNVVPDAIVVPSSAIKTANGASYVEVFDPALANSEASTGAVSTVAPKRVTVSVGASNDTDSQIVTGLVDGQQVVIRTVTAAKAATTQAPSLIGGGFGGSQRPSGTTRTTGTRSN